MTKIEQVAAAMALATNGGKWDDGHYCEDHKALWMKRAAAAIEAMRVPTDAMLEAGWEASRPAAPIEMTDRQTFLRAVVGQPWNAAIDAALQEKPDV